MYNIEQSFRNTLVDLFYFLVGAVNETICSYVTHTLVSIKFFFVEIVMQPILVEMELTCTHIHKQTQIKTHT